MKKTPLDLLEALVKEKLKDATPRYLDQEELLKMQTYWLCSAEPIANMITFSVSIPKWNKASIFGDCSVPVWAWEREGSSYISYLAEMPAELEGKVLQGKLSMLNNQVSFAGRFFLAENATSYYYLTQAVFCRKDEDGRRGRPVELAAVRAARDQVDYAILYSMAAVIGDMARAIDMVAEVCLPISHLAHLDFNDLDF